MLGFDTAAGGASERLWPLAIKSRCASPDAFCCALKGCKLCAQEEFDLKGDYVRWRQKQGFAFAAHAFMYSPASKAELLRIENTFEMCAFRTANAVELLAAAAPVVECHLSVFQGLHPAPAASVCAFAPLNCKAASRESPG